MLRRQITVRIQYNNFMMKIAGKFESMSKHEKTSKLTAAKAAKLMKHEDADVRSVAASALTQVENEKKLIPLNAVNKENMPILLKYQAGYVTYEDVGRLMQLLAHVREFVESDETEFRAWQVTLSNDLKRIDD
jgi:hypothetical protein